MRRWLHKTTDEFAGIFLGIFLISLALFSANAARISEVTDIMSRLRVGTESNHSISFVTPSGVAEGLSVTINFPTEFGVSGITEDDVDFLDDGTYVSTAADCSGVEKAAVLWTGNTLSLRVCPGDGGAVAPGSTIRINIGTNAIDSGLGQNRITNPSVPGVYRLAIAGSFADSGQAIVVINADDSVNVSACVGVDCPTGEYGHAPSGNPIVWGGQGWSLPVVPTISDVKINNITPVSVDISWKTDLVADSYVIFGTNYKMNAVRGNSDMVLEHSVTVFGLMPNTEFNIRVRSMGLFGDLTTSEIFQFKTLEKKDSITSTPKISNIRVVETGGTWSKIIWTTDIPAWCRVEYGLSEKYGSELSEQTYTGSHLVSLNNLLPSTTYHYRVIGIGENGEQISSKDLTFTTFDTIGPKIFDTRVENISTDSFDVLWKTDESSIGSVEYGRSIAYESGVVKDEAYGLSHRVTIKNLADGNAYHIKIRATDELDNVSESEDITTTTRSLVPPPVNVSELSAVYKDGVIVLRWANLPQSENYEVLVRRKENMYPLGVEDGKLVYRGRENSVIDSGVKTNKEYFYKVLTINKKGEYSSGAIISLKTTEGEGNISQNVPAKVPRESIAFGNSQIVILVNDVPRTIINDKISIFAESRLYIELPAELLKPEVSSAYISFDGANYSFQDIGGKNFNATILAPKKTGIYTMAVLINYKDGSSAHSRLQVNIVAPGRVMEKRDGQETFVDNAKVTLNADTGLWDGKSFGQENPQYTNEKGEYYFQVPDGKYSLTIEKNGYKKQITVFKSYNGPIAEVFYTQIYKPTPILGVINENCFSLNDITKNILNIVKLIKCIFTSIF